MTGRSGFQPKCQPDCTCGKHRAPEQLTTWQCYDRARPLGRSDFQVLAQAFGFEDAFEFELFMVDQQRKASA